jgi:hypothetical protein
MAAALTSISAGVTGTISEAPGSSRHSWFGHPSCLLAARK